MNTWTTSFEDRFQAFLEQSTPQGPLNMVVGISGGVDSMTLLHLLHQTHHRLFPIHLQYRLRGEDSEADEALVRETCSRLGLPLKVVEAPLHPQEANIQSKARSLRYQAFESYKDALNADVLVTGHHLDDALETLWLNLSRGTGIDGLKGISVFAAGRLRPLRFATAEEIRQYAHLMNLSWREDQSNFQTKYKRNKIRKQLIPVLKELNPAWNETLERSFQKLECTARIQKQWLQEKRNRLFHENPDTGQIRLLFLELASAGIDQYILSWLLLPYGFSEAQGLEVWNLIGAETGKGIQGKTYEIFAESNALVLQERSPHLPSTWTCHHKEGLEKQISPPFRVEEATPKDLPETHWFALPQDWESQGLASRPWKSGDRIAIRGGSKKVSDLLNEAGLRGEAKKNTCVWLLGDTICWIPGIRKAWLESEQKAAHFVLFSIDQH